MAGFIKASRAKNIAKATDTVGGGGVRPSGVYDATVNLAYGVNSESSDAQAISVEFTLDAGGKLYRKFWFAGADGKVFTEKDGVKRHRKDFLLADSLAQFATEGEFDLFDLETEQITVKQKRDNKEVNVKVESFPELKGLKVKLCLIQAEEYKTNFVDGEWIETDEVVPTLQVNKILDEEGFTLNEYLEEAEEPAFMDEWLKTWKDKTIKVKPKEEKKSLKKSTSDGGAKSRIAGRKGLRR